MVDDGLADLVGDAGRGAGPARAAAARRAGRHPSRPDPVRRRQHADHRARPRRARLDAAGRGRPGGAGRDDRGPAADRRLPGGRARRARGAHRRQHPGRHQEQRHPRPRRPRSSTSAPTASATRTSDPGRRSGGSSPPSARPPGRPQEPEFELFDRFPLTDNDAGGHRAGRRGVRATTSASRARTLPLQTASEDFSDIPNALGVPVHLLGHRRHRPRHLRARRAGRPGRPGHPGQPLRRPSPRSSSPPSTPAPRPWSSRRPRLAGRDALQHHLDLGDVRRMLGTLPAITSGADWSAAGVTTPSREAAVAGPV